MFQKLTFAVAIAWSMTTGATAGAFGINQGAMTQDLKVVETIDRFETSTVYHVEPPLPNPEFSAYLVTVDDRTGACSVEAFGRTIEGDRDGKKVRAAFDKVRNILTEKYGKPEGGSLGLEDYKAGRQDFATSLYNGDGMVTASWAFTPDAADDLSSITLFVMADSPTATSLSIAYDFENADGCTAASRKAGN